MAVTATVTPSAAVAEDGGEVVHGAGSRHARRSQMSGSLTWRRTQIVKNAGSTPTKKTARQPQRGSTISVTTAARP